MRNWRIEWGKNGLAILVAPDMPSAIEIFVKRYGHQIDGDVHKELKLIRILDHFEVITRDDSDIPF